MNSIVAGYHFPSMVDYPGHTSMVLYTQGCNLTCGYCHNVNLIKKVDDGKLYIDELLEVLRKNEKYCDHVVITGGEPTVHGMELVNLCTVLKGEGYTVKLDTNGSDKMILGYLLDLELVDYVALDWKSLDYLKLGSDAPLKIIDVLDVLKMIRNSTTEFEIRTTLVHPFVNKFVLHTMCYVILDHLSECKNFTSWYWQNATLDPVRHKRYRAYNFDWANSMKKWLMKTYEHLPVEEKVSLRNFAHS